MNSAIHHVLELAYQNHQAGRLQEAARLYQGILAQHPNQPETLHLLGVLWAQIGRNGAAVELIQRALESKPNWPMAYNNLGGALHGLGHLDQAVAAYRTAVVLKSDYADAYSNLGATLQEKGEVEGAIIALRQAILFCPGNSLFHCNLASALNEREQFDEALAACRTALTHNPHYAEAENNFGNALRGKGRLDESITAFNRALTLKPNFADAHYNLGIALREKGRLIEAATAFRKAIALQPNHAKAHLNLGLMLLTLGDFREGWEEYEWRWNCDELRLRRRQFAQPQWNGRPLNGQTILLHCEQGIGDTLQFIRYIPSVAECGGRVVVECQAELRRLLTANYAGISVVAKGEPLPEFDLHCPLMSLPKVMKTTLASIPTGAPYLHADCALVESWRKRVESDSTLLKVGLVWAGRRQHKNDHNRSMTLEDLAPLGNVTNVKFFSVQKDRPSQRQDSARFSVTDITADLNDFSDTAALIANLDLIISVDTSVAHLAGAMGKPVWTLLPFVPDWRWMLERSDSPWYPTMRLFRSSSAGDWGSVVDGVGEALARWVGE